MLLQVEPSNFPRLQAALNPGSDAFICISAAKTPIYPLPIVILPLTAVLEVVFYGVALSTVLYIRKASLKMSTKARKLNAQLSLLLLMQVRMEGRKRSGT